jgi:hypothetical protein
MFSLGMFVLHINVGLVFIRGAVLRFSKIFLRKHTHNNSTDLTIIFFFAQS